MARPAEPAAVEAVFFDIGGPIYPDDAFVDAVLLALDGMRAERGAPPTDRRRFRSVYDELRRRQAGSLRAALAEEFLDGSHDLELLRQRTGEHWEHRVGTLYPDVVPCLRALHGHVKIGVLANQEAGVVDSLRRDGVAEFVDIWAVSALVGIEKPDPALFRWALDAAGVDAERAAHVGNRLDNDVRPARAVGMHAIWVLRGEAPPVPTPAQLAEPTAAVRSLAEIPPLVVPGAGRAAP